MDLGKDAIAKRIDENPATLDKPDDDGRTMLHWVSISLNFSSTPIKFIRWTMR